MVRLAGWVYGPDGFRRGTVHVRDGRVDAVTEAVDRDALARGIVLPLFVNAHTHLGDSVVREEPQGTLADVVAPPNGLKFRRLAQATKEDLRSAMRRSLRRMVRGGTGAFCDFREGGVPGAALLRNALKDAEAEGTILGRPEGLEYDSDEVDGILELAQGVGVSSAVDWPHDALESIAAHVHRRDGLFALHASEEVREDLDPVLDLHPSFLVHLTAATESDWIRTAQEGIPVAVTPRSQAFFGRVPDLPGMRAVGLRLMLGTDNAMLAAPSVLTELGAAYDLARLRGGLPPADILAMAYAGANLLTGPSSNGIHEGGLARLLVLDLPLDGDPAYQTVRASEADIALLGVGTRIWQRRRGWTSEE